MLSNLQAHKSHPGYLRSVLLHDLLMATFYNVKLASWITLGSEITWKAS